MAYKTILVYFSNESQVAELMPVARLLAGPDTHLVGFHVRRSVDIYPGISYPVDPRLFANLAQSYQDTAEACERKFRVETRTGDFIAEWRQTAAGRRHAEDVATEHARLADLVICSQAKPDEDQFSNIAVEQLILESGRPVLVVPVSANIVSIGEKPIVAWDGSKQACRAAFDAIPLLTKAVTTSLLEVGSRGGSDPEAGLAAGDMCATMDRHGVKCEVLRTTAEDRNVGEEILSQVSRKGADLLVMGGYGHSRMREILLGGATRHVLRHMSVPVLMSH